MMQGSCQGVDPRGEVTGVDGVTGSRHGWVAMLTSPHFFKIPEITKMCKCINLQYLA